MNVSQAFYSLNSTYPHDLVKLELLHVASIGLGACPFLLDHHLDWSSSEAVGIV
jgi:hypothetical protein